VTLLEFAGVRVEARPIGGYMIPVVFVDDDEGRRRFCPYPPIPAQAVGVWLEAWLGEMALETATARFADR
jgi:hypothetical protein